MEKFKDGDILVTDTVTNDMISVLKRAKGIICEEKGLDCHAAVLGMALDIPVITGADSATKILKTGTVITMDAKKGYVFGGVV